MVAAELFAAATAASEPTASITARTAARKSFLISFLSRGPKRNPKVDRRNPTYASRRETLLELTFRLVTLGPARRQQRAEQPRAARRPLPPSNGVRVGDGLRPEAGQGEPLDPQRPGRHVADHHHARPEAIARVVARSATSHPLARQTTCEREASARLHHC